MEHRHLGRTTLEPSRLGLGGAALGNLFSAIDEDEAMATVAAAVDAGVSYFDVAPLYGLGLAEERLGRALTGRNRDSFMVSTKVGRLVVDEPGADPGIFAVASGRAAVFDFSRDGVLRSLEESLSRLGLDRIDLAFVHDPDDHEAEALSGAFPALLELRDQGVVSAVGAGMNQPAMLERFVEAVDLDAVLLAGRWTLVDRGGASLLDLCLDRGVGVVLGGVFNSGLLADPGADSTFDYAPAPEDLRARATAMGAVCEAAGTTLIAAALGFARQHPSVASVLVGARSAAEMSADAAAFAAPVPESLMDDLTRLA